MIELFIYIAITALGTYLVWKGSDLLESSAQSLSIHYGLPPVVHGSIVLAVGSSFPELSSTVLTVLIHDEFELGLSVIIGSAIFNILVIPGLSGLFAPKRLEAHRDLVFRDAQFYLIAVAVLLITFSLAVIYQPVKDTTGLLSGTITRPYALIPLLLYGIYLFLQQQEAQEHKPNDNQKSIHVGKQWGIMLVSLVLVVVGVEGLVRSALFFGDYFHTPSFIWGLTMIAAVTSLPDAFVSVRMAQKGKGVESISNVLGSNIFDLLVAIPVGVLIAGSAVVHFKIAVPLMAALTIATIVLFLLLRIKFALRKNECWILLVAYLVFVLWVVLETIGVLHFLPD